MQQYYPRNVDVDPVRSSFSNSKELLPRKNIFNMMKNKNVFNDSNSKQPDLYRENIFNETYNKSNALNNEIVEKDKKIQELEFKLQQIEIEKDSFKNKLGIIKKYEEDNKDLSLKLKKEYEKNKEIIMLRNKLSLFEQTKKEDDKVISELKRKVNIIENENDEEITLNIFEENNSENEDEGIKELDYDEIYKQTLENEKKRNIQLKKYKNDRLKDLICKHNVNINKNRVDDIFIKMKIVENVNITKDLISKIIYELKQ